MRTIPLTQGLYAQVDDELYERLQEFKWRALKGGQTYYATRHVMVDGKTKTIYMHRHIMEVTDSNVLVDHRDHNGLNNCTSNLRKCTTRQNLQNMRSRPGSASRFVGVCWHKGDQKWRARIRTPQGKRKFLGNFDNEEDAARARDAASKEFFGEFAHLNIE